MNSHTYLQQEMEQRIKRFDSECETAIDHINNLRHQAKSFIDQLACEPSELRTRFLQCTSHIDEFLYHVTEFNLAVGNLENNANLGHAYKNSTPRNTRSHSNTLRSAETKDYRREQTQVKNENWRESCALDSSRTRSIEKKQINGNSKEITTDVRGSSQDVFLHRKADGSPSLALPPQPKLDPASVSKATIVTVYGAQLWLVFDDDLLFNLVLEMAEYYKNQEMNQDFVPQSVCAYYDEADTMSYFRAFYINSEGDPEVFLVDTGEFQPALQSRLRPLDPRFCFTPPLAHLCSLADVDETEDKELEDKQTEFLKQFLGQRFKVKIKMDSEDDPSKPMAVYLYLDDGRAVNELLVQALASSKPESNDDSLIYSTPNIADEKYIITPDIEVPNHNIKNGNETVNKMDIIKDRETNNNIDEELDYSKCPEYENAVVAVTGYDNRDEMDICKHYTGGESCFKGNRCKKRHVMMHPDGWTLDRVPVAVKCRPAVLPAPGTCHAVKVTHVDDTCQLFLQFEQKDEPMSLADLVHEMTRSAADSKPLQLAPAPGELVAACFTDGRYYRARVIALDDGQTEVMYIDYGNTATVSNTELRPLSARGLTLPAQAVPSWLAGVSGRTDAKVLKELALDKTMEAHIIARDYDELTVKLVDSEGFDVAEQLAAFTGIALKPYTVEDDSQRLFHHVPA